MLGRVVIAIKPNPIPTRKERLEYALFPLIVYGVGGKGVGLVSRSNADMPNFCTDKALPCPSDTASLDFATIAACLNRWAINLKPFTSEYGLWCGGSFRHNPVLANLNHNAR